MEQLVLGLNLETSQAGGQGQGQGQGQAGGQGQGQASQATAGGIIEVAAYANRRTPGRLYMPVRYGLREISCLLRADDQAAARNGNASRDPVEPFGDTPTGMYEAIPFRRDLPATAVDVLRSYGPWGWFALRPVSGDALAAEKNGRFGLLIHGGDPGKGGELRPTFGCIRVYNADLKAMLDACVRLGVTKLVVNVWEIGGKGAPVAGQPAAAAAAAGGPGGPGGPGDPSGPPPGGPGDPQAA